MSNYKLTKTTLKNGTFHYEVTDKNGVVISERNSKRDYVACTINGGFYFGRLDLIGKGDHGRFINSWRATIDKSFDEMRKDYVDLTIERYNEIKADFSLSLDRIEKIAYLVQG